MTSLIIPATIADLLEEVDALDQIKLLHDPDTDLYWKVIRKIDALNAEIELLRARP